MSYTASDLSHFNDPTSSSTTNPRGNNPTPSNKNPSYSDRQSQADLSKTRAQRWSQDQQQQQSWDAQRSSASNSTSSLTTTSPSGFWQGVNDIDEMDAGTQLGIQAAVMGAELPDNASAAEIAGFYVGETLGAAAMVMSGEALIPLAEGAAGLAISAYSSLSRFWGGAAVEEMMGLEPGLYNLNPGDIRFTQPTVSPFFSNGARIDDIAGLLREGELFPTDLPPIQVVSQDGQLYSLDNRRLLSFNMAGMNEIPVEVVSLDDTSVAKRFVGRFDPIAGEGNYVAVATRSQRQITQQLLIENNLIQGIQLGN